MLAAFCQQVPADFRVFCWFVTARGPVPVAVLFSFLKFASVCFSFVLAMVQRNL